MEDFPYDAYGIQDFIVQENYRSMNRLYDMAIRIGACNHFKNALMDAFGEAAWWHESISTLRPRYLAPSLRYTKVHKFYMMVMLFALHEGIGREELGLTMDLEHSEVWEKMVEDFENTRKRIPMRQISMIECVTSCLSVMKVMATAASTIRGSRLWSFTSTKTQMKYVPLLV